MSVKALGRLVLASGLALAAGGALAQDGAFSDGVIRLGVMNDRSGIYADMSGEGSAIAARMAAEQFGNAINGVPVEIIVADHQNKPDVGVSIATKWYDADGVDAIFDINNSAVSLAINNLMPDRKKLFLHGSASADLSGKNCAPRSAQWQYSVYAASSKAVSPEMIESGIDTFFIVAVDYAMGESITEVFTEAVEKIGGKVVGVVRHPLNSPDMSSVLLQAQASGAKAIVLANAGADAGNVVRQAREFGIDMPIIATALTTDVIDSFGLDVMQGVIMLSQFDMFRKPESKAWLEAFAERNGGKTPTSVQASTYSAALNYLQAVQDIGTDDADAVMARLKEMTINDAFADNGRIREDGLHSHDMYLSTIKSPDESAGPGDYFNVTKVLSGDEANVPLSESECPFVKN